MQTTMFRHGRAPVVPLLALLVLGLLLPSTATANAGSTGSLNTASVNSAKADDCKTGSTNSGFDRVSVYVCGTGTHLRSIGGEFGRPKAGSPGHRTGKVRLWSYDDKIVRETAQVTLGPGESTGDHFPINADTFDGDKICAVWIDYGNRPTSPACLDIHR